MWLVERLDVCSFDVELFPGEVGVGLSLGFHCALGAQIGSKLPVSLDVLEPRRVDLIDFVG